MVVATCFRLFYGVIKYADFEYDIVNKIICIFVVNNYEKYTNFEMVVATCFHRSYKSIRLIIAF